jgi:hypothetical protein
MENKVPQAIFNAAANVHADPTQQAKINDLSMNLSSIEHDVGLVGDDLGLVFPQPPAVEILPGHLASTNFDARKALRAARKIAFALNTIIERCEEVYVAHAFLADRLLLKNSVVIRRSDDPVLWGFGFF